MRVWCFHRRGQDGFFGVLDVILRRHLRVRSQESRVSKEAGSSFFSGGTVRVFTHLTRERRKPPRFFDLGYLKK